MMVWFIFEDVPEAIGVNFEPDDADKEGDETKGISVAGIGELKSSMRRDDGGIVMMLSPKASTEAEQVGEFRCAAWKQDGDQYYSLATRAISNPDSFDECPPTPVPAHFENDAAGLDLEALGGTDAAIIKRPTAERYLTNWPSDLPGKVVQVEHIRLTPC